MLLEDIQSSISQANNILVKNGVNNSEKISKEIAKFVENARDSLEPQYRNWVSHDHIPAISLMLVATNGEHQESTQQEYINYLKISDLAGKKYLSKHLRDTLNNIVSNKLHKDPEKKREAISKYYVEFIDTVHRKMPDKSDQNVNQDNISNRNNPDIAYSDENIVVFLADTRNKCIAYGNKNLCISWRGANNYFWRYRMGSMNYGVGMTTYFVYKHGEEGKQGFIVDALGDEDGPVRENIWGYTPIPQNGDYKKTKEEIIKMHPYVEPAFDKIVFKFIPHSEKEN